MAKKCHGKIIYKLIKEQKRKTGSVSSVKICVAEFKLVVKSSVWSEYSKSLHERSVDKAIVVKGNATDRTCLDFSKVFDKISQNIVLDLR